MEITNSLEVPLRPDEAWRLLLDIPRILPCVPGAELIEAVDDTTYKGKVSVRLGPVALSFTGVARFDELDAANRRARVTAKGSDAKGRGGADAVVEFQLEPAGAGTSVAVVTNVNLSGSVAQYGRGTGIIQGVATQLTAQFARNLQAMLEQPEGLGTPDVPAPPSAPPPSVAAVPPPMLDLAAPPPAPGGGDWGAARAEAAAARSEAAAARVEAAVARMEAALARLQAGPPGTPRPAKPAIGGAKPISGVALMGTVAWNMVTGAFSRKRATP